MDIEKLDKNFKVETNIDIDGLKFYNPLLAPFRVYGVFHENGHFYRMPESSAAKVSEAVKSMTRCTAGGRIRFVTDSPYVAVSVKYETCGKMPHFAFTGSIGLDLYADDNDGYGDYYVGTFTPPFNITDGYEGVVRFRSQGLHTVTLNMPLYSRVTELYIGLDENAVLSEAKGYKSEKPIVFYGSSITMGGCASKPGCLYSNIVSRKLNYDSINLGFSGNAKGETAMAEYIASLDMCAFVFDYDHNAPSCEHLQKTHEPFYKIVRAAHPDIPIIFMSRPLRHLATEGEKKSRAIIEENYKKAIERRENVYFIPGEKLFSDAVFECALVDGTHPNDSGFVEMAERVCEILEKVL